MISHLLTSKVQEDDEMRKDFWENINGHLSLVPRSKRDLEAGLVFMRAASPHVWPRAVHIYANGNGSISRTIYKHLDLFCLLRGHP